MVDSFQVGDRVVWGYFDQTPGVIIGSGVMVDRGDHLAIKVQGGKSKGEIISKTGLPNLRKEEEQNDG